MSTAALDPITFEVIRNKLSAITEEQAITLENVSGSPVVTEATDFNVGIYLGDGSVVTMGPQVLFHSGSMASVVRNIIDDCEDNPGIEEGDMFVLNDPYKGALHQMDVTFVAPVFAEGRRVAWVGACAHQIDLGGMNFGSWSLAARGIQEEAMLLPGIKLVERGTVRADLWSMLMGMTRMPTTVGLDFKAMIAANNVAVGRLTELFERYGLDTVLEVMAHELDHSERELRQVLRELPDGVFRAVDWIEHDGHDNKLYEFRLTVTKTGDQLDFDFTGTSEQAPGFINCTWSGLVAGVFTALLPTLAPSLRWNEGLLRPVSITAPKGTVANASWPAPVSSATVSAMWVVTNVSFSALSRLVTTSPSAARHGAGVTKGSMSVMVLNGLYPDGDPYGTFLLDSTAGGGGAYGDHDGLTASGDFCVPRPAIANVESHEADGQILFLYRSILPDSAGPGRQRGGSAVGLALTPHGADQLEAMLIGHGVEVPNSAGIFGGLEGCCNRNELLHGVDGVSPVGRVCGAADHETWIGDRDVMNAKPGFFTLRKGDVVSYSFQGGGGYGDPLDRDPARVAHDVATRQVTRTSAAAIYGVVLDNSGAVDTNATAARRAEIRADRLGEAPTKDAAPAGEPRGRCLTPDLCVGTDRHIRCSCGHDFGVGPDWKRSALRRTVAPESHGPLVQLHEELELREYVCPSCARLLESNVCRVGAADLVTSELV
ncbi:Acetophenone carboxylase delta subunit [Nocardia farcinica]|uniref:hydantoinase B/oxoprolinase family protein n=1 Tax=Nocardia farcinica TaxID=37329 RepID=UPI000BF6451D|nr:hydantoinase B/oxoprolinase family protein [Nocardia farcinica]PFW98998.1 Acetophenone carboxylase delta subunit [Nocardia farcinica]PFX05931.1 Acetophenone carboxylase delta subunit [Nocardia farcinica]